MKTYTVRAEWDTAGWWVVVIPDVPGALTQSRRLDRVSEDVAEVIELMAGETPGTYEIDLQWSVPVGAGAKAHEARELRGEAEATRQAVEALSAEGFTYRDIGTMTGVSYQRAQQLAPAKSRVRRGRQRTVVTRRKRRKAS